MKLKINYLFSFLSIILILLLVSGCSSNSNKPEAEEPANSQAIVPTVPKIEKREFNWYCKNILGKPLSMIRNELGKQDDCEGCTEESGELKYYNIMTDAMGTDQTLAITYYKGVITRCRISGSYPTVECIKEYVGD